MKQSRAILLIKKYKSNEGGKVYMLYLGALVDIFKKINSVIGVQKQFMELQNECHNDESYLLLAVAHGSSAQVKKLMNIFSEERSFVVLSDKSRQEKLKLIKTLETKHNKRVENLWKARAIR